MHRARRALASTSGAVVRGGMQRAQLARDSTRARGMLDILFVTILVLFIALSLAYVRGCERL